jgi:peptidoglycan hydrolase-like protein with peptidoglycan-binding domain
MKILLSEEEKKNILGMHISKGYKTLSETKVNILDILNEQYTKDNVIAVQNALLNNKISVGPKGPDGKFGNDTINAVKSFQRKNGLKDDGQVGPCTAKALGVNPLVGSGPCKNPNVKSGKPISDTTKTTPDTSKTSVVKTPVGYDCIAVDANTCKKISPNSETLLGSGTEKQCTAYARKCLSEYGVDSLGGSAWEALRTVKNKGGNVKYNMFENNFDFDGLENNIKKLGSSFKGCECFDKTQTDSVSSVDITCDGGKLSKLITGAYPNSSTLDVSKLQLGDIVGMYWKDSGNKGKAFCQKAKVSKDGTITNKNTTINTHLGFVGAIKNGVPIIFHNVHGKHTAVPAKNFMSKSSPAMITWVVSDPDISQKLRPETTKKQEKGMFDSLSQYLGF